MVSLMDMSFYEEIIELILSKKIQTKEEIHKAKIKLCKKYGIDKIICNSSYPQSKTLPRLQSILSFLALKLSSFRRYGSDDMWCMDRGTGLFAGLNVLPKTTWFSSYSHRVTKNMNVEEKVTKDKENEKTEVKENSSK